MYESISAFKERLIDVATRQRHLISSMVQELIQIQKICRSEEDRRTVQSVIFGMRQIIASYDRIPEYLDVGDFDSANAIFATAKEVLDRCESKVQSVIACRAA